MPKYPVSKPREIINALKRMGFEVVRSSGSHIHLRRINSFVTVPFHNRDLKIKTLKSIIQQAGISVDELKKYL